MKLSELSIGDLITIENRFGKKQVKITGKNKNYIKADEKEFNIKTGYEKQRRKTTNLFLYRISQQ